MTDPERLATVGIRVVAEGRMPDDLAGRIRKFLCFCFPEAVDTFATTRAWHGVGPTWTVWAENSRSELVAHLGVVNRVILVGEETVRVAGIQSACVHPDYRGTGLFDMLMRRYVEHARAFPFEYGLLFCIPELVKVYQRTGWRELPQVEITRLDDEEPEQGLRERGLPGRNVGMFLPLARERFPSGAIHLLGNDW